MQNLDDAELRLVKRKLGSEDWSGGTITKFMAAPETRALDIKLPKSGGRLILFAGPESNIDAVARNVDGILAWMGVPAKFTVHLWLQQWLRQIRTDEWPGRLSVNGGFATPGIPEIFVYREEEYDRVVIHEIIHAMKWDWKMQETPLPCWGIQGRMMPHLFEAWTELYAEWLWCGWHNVNWEVQMRWQQLQATQILARHTRSGRNWNEDTNVFAYYILKAALAPHISFLWTFGNGSVESERIYVLCRLVKSNLDILNNIAARTVPTYLSMRMTIKL
jgi:hypothetical protein